MAYPILLHRTFDSNLRTFTLITIFNHLIQNGTKNMAMSPLNVELQTHF